MLIRFLLLLIIICTLLLMMLPNTVHEAKLKRKCFLGLTITLGISVVLLIATIFYFQDPLIKGSGNSELLFRKIQQTPSQKNLLALSNYDFKNLSEADIQKVLQHQAVHHLRVSNFKVQDIPSILAFLKYGEHIQKFEILFSDALVLEELFKNLYFSSKLKTLIVKNSRVNETTIQNLTEFLRQQVYLNELELTNLNLKNAFDLSPLKAYLSKKPLLHRLSLSNNRLTDASIAPLLSTLVGLPALQRLDLSNNQLQDESSQQLAEYLAVKPATLQYLNLSDNGFSSVSIIKLLPYISDHSSLKTLDLRRNPLDDLGVKRLKQQTKGHSSLRQIYITPSNLSEEVQDTIYEENLMYN